MSSIIKESSVLLMMKEVLFCSICYVMLCFLDCSPFHIKQWNVAVTSKLGYIPGHLRVVWYGENYTTLSVCSLLPVKKFNKNS